jgi:hypothetical protein
VLTVYQPTIVATDTADNKCEAIIAIERQPAAGSDQRKPLI